MKLLATDFDSTLFNAGDYTKNIRYVNKFVDEGNVFAIVTGRYKDSLLDDIKNTGLKYNYLICNDGGIIFDESLNIIYQNNDIDTEVAKEVSLLLNDSPYVTEWYIDTGLSVTQDMNTAANRILGRFSDREKAIELLRLIKGKYPKIDGYISDRWINLAGSSVNKGLGIRHLIDILGIEEKDVYTIGDNTNDVPMSDYAFNNFRMTNSVTELSDKTKKAYNAVYELIEDILKDGSK